jgi:hypothetical protein
MAVTNNLTLIHACETTTDATTSCVMDGGAAGTYLSGGGEFIQGSAAYGFDLDIETLTEVFTPSANLNLSGQTVWIWLYSLTQSFLDTWANGGITCRLDDGTNYSEWYLTGSDRPSAGGYVRLCFSTGTTPDAISGTLNLSSVNTIEFDFIGVTKSKLPENVFIDYLQYGADGTGMTMTGGSFATPETFADVEGDDVTAAIGMISESNGVYYLNGPIEFGDNSGTGNAYFADTNQLLSSISHYRSFTTSNRTSAESLVSSSHNTISLVGNGTGVTSFEFGEKTGSLGYAGCTVKTGGDRRIVFTCTDTNVDILHIFGSNFIDCGAISLPLNKGGGDTEVISSNFNGCDQINPDTCLFQSNIIAATNASTTGGLLVDSSGTANISDLTSISGGTGHSIYINATGTYNFVGWGFSGYGGTPGSNLVSSSGSTDAGVYNNSGGAVTINVSGGGDSPSCRNGAGATTQVNANVSVIFDNLKDNSEVRIYTTGTSTELAGIEDATAGTPDDRSFTASLSAGASVDYVIHNFQPGDEIYQTIRVETFTWPSTDTTITVQQQLDRNAEN